MNDMEYEKLGTYCDVISGYAFKSADWQDEGVPVIKIGNISNGYDVILDESTQYVDESFCDNLDKKYRIENGDILISLTGSHINQPNSMVGRSCRSYTDRLYLLNQRAGKIIPFDTVDKDYLYYLFTTKAIKYDIANRAYGGANQVNVSPKDIKNIKWGFPEISIQRKIADILCKYDALIHNNNKRIKVLEQMAESLYKEWFVRFRFPGHENVEFVDDLPREWEVKRLGEFGISLDTGSRPSGGVDDSLTEGVPSLGAEAVKGLAEFDYSSVKYIPHEYYGKMKRGKFDGNAIMVYKDGAYIGKTTIFRNGFPFKIFAANEHVFLMRANNFVYQDYLYFTLHQKEYFYLMQNLNRNAAQPGLAQPDIKRIKITVPPENVVMQFNAIIEPIFDEVFQLAKANRNIAQQRDRLLPRLMSGKLEV